MVAVNELRLMMPGDILILYTDGLSDHGGRQSPYFPKRLEAVLQLFKAAPAKTIVEEILKDVLLHAAPSDDLSFVVIKKN